MAYRVNLEPLADVGEKLHNRLKAYYIEARDLRDALQASDDANDILNVPVKNQAFQTFVANVQARYTNPQIKSALESYLSDTVTLADVVGLVSGWNDLATYVEANATAVTVAIDPTTKRRVYSFGASVQTIKADILTRLDAIVALVSE